MRHTVLVLQGKQQLSRIISKLARVFHPLNHMVQVVLAHKRTAGAALVGGAFLMSVPAFNHPTSGQSAQADETVQSETTALEQVEIKVEQADEASGDTSSDTTSKATQGNSSTSSIKTTITSSTTVNGQTETYSQTASSKNGNSSSSVNISINGDGESNVKIKGSSNTKLKFKYEDNSEYEM